MVQETKPIKRRTTIRSINTRRTNDFIYGDDDMRILSFDISASPGVAVLELSKGKPKLIAVDHLETNSGYTDAQRFAVIESFVTNFVYNYGDFDIAVREKFIKGGSKRGTQLVFGAWASVDRALATFDYAIPAENEIVASMVKRLIGGHGGAGKDDVAEGVIRILGEEVRSKLFTERGRLLDDRADAVAIGLAWAIQKGMIIG